MPLNGGTITGSLRTNGYLTARNNTTCPTYVDEGVTVEKLNSPTAITCLNQSKLDHNSLTFRDNSGNKGLYSMDKVEISNTYNSNTHNINLITDTVYGSVIAIYDGNVAPNRAGISISPSDITKYAYWGNTGIASLNEALKKIQPKTKTVTKAVTIAQGATVNVEFDFGLDSMLGVVAYSLMSTNAHVCNISVENANKKIIMPVKNYSSSFATTMSCTCLYI